MKFRRLTSVTTSPLTSETSRLYKLSGEARQQANNIHLVDQEVHRLQFQLAICQTARNACAAALQVALPKDQ
jgi:hypothetical protein